MRIVIALVVCAGVLGTSGFAGAAQISSPSIFGVPTQAFAECVVVNGGTTALPVTVKILDEPGNTVTSSTCDGAIAPNGFCQVAHSITSLGAYSCIAIAGSVANLRGAMVIDEPVPDGFGGTDEQPFRSAPLR
jgi:hypothetical protein